MSAVLQTHPGAASDVNSRLTFQKNLQTVTNKIHATSNVDEIMLEVSADICTLFNADRLTIYTVGEDKSHNPNLRFLQEVDKRTGYRTKQMLVAPIAEPGSSELVGVVQLINNRAGVPFGQLAEEGVAELCQTLAIALKQRQKPQVLKTKYDFLVSDAVISAAEFELAARSARKKAVDVETVLTDEFQVKLPAIGAALAKFFGVPYESFKPDRIKPMDLLKNLKRDYVESNQWVPIEEAKEGLVILCLDPERVKSSRIVQNVFAARKLAYRVTTLKEFRETLKAFYGAEAADTGDIGDMLHDLEEDEVPAEVGGDDDVSAAADNELVKLVNKIIIDAYNQGASDIHIEPYPGKGKTEIRLRKDGTLVPYIEVPGSYRNAMVARIKIMCDLDISEKRKPQDGKIKFKKFGPLDIELRVATIPSQGGVEDIVMRILAAGEPIPLEKLGLSPSNFPKLKETVSKPYGLFFVCGPTGSGKTTTLHSVLGFLNTPDTKIWTAEDPVEITQKGLRQVQVNKKAGLDFAAVMKAFLRADPDIIMVGEMRDKETTGTGIEASLTGHLVFATLHTNSAPESIIRLLDMGMDPFNFADALLGVLAQRLAKRLCTHCREAYVATAEDVQIFVEEYCEELRATPPFRQDAAAAHEAARRELLGKYGNEQGQIQFHRPHGCRECDETGYRGRIGLHELMVGSEHVKRLVQEHAHVPELFAAAIDEGMRTLKMDGMEKVLQGLTDMK